MQGSSTSVLFTVIDTVVVGKHGDDVCSAQSVCYGYRYGITKINEISLLSITEYSY